MKTAVTAANKEKAHAQVAMSYTLGDAYTLDYWVDLAKRIEDMGAILFVLKIWQDFLFRMKRQNLSQR